MRTADQDEKEMLDREATERNEQDRQADEEMYQVAEKMGEISCMALESRFYDGQRMDAHHSKISPSAWEHRVVGPRLALG